MAENDKLRSQIWQSYQKGLTGSPVLRLADQLRISGVVFKNESEFSSFLDSFNQATVGAASPAVAIGELYEKYLLSKSSEDLTGALEDKGASSVADAANSSTGGGGAGGGGGDTPVATGGEDPNGDSNRNVVLLLQEIRDAIRALSEGTGVTPFEEKLKDPSYGQIAEEAAFGEAPSTGIGRFAHRVRGIARRFKRRIGSLRKAKGAGATAGATTGAAAGGAGGAAGGATAAAGAGGSVGAFAAGATIFAVAAVEFGKAVYDFAKSQEKEMRRLAEVGADQSVAAAQLDAERTLRDIKTARETGESSMSMADSINKFEEALRPIESLITNISNTIAGRLLDVVTFMLDAVRPIVDVLTDIYNALPGKKLDKEKLRETNWDVLKRIEEQQMNQNQHKWPGAAQAGPRGGTLPYAGKI